MYTLDMQTQNASCQHRKCGAHDLDRLLADEDAQARKRVLPVVIRHLTYLLEMEADSFRHLQLVLAMVAVGDRSGDRIDRIVTDAYVQSRAARLEPEAAVGAARALTALPAGGSNWTNNNNDGGGGGRASLSTGETEAYLGRLFATVLRGCGVSDNGALIEALTQRALRMTVGRRLCIWLVGEAQAQLDRAYAEVRTRTRRCDASLLSHLSQSVLAAVCSPPSPSFAARYRRTLASVSADMRAHALRNAGRKVAGHVARLLTSRDVGVEISRWYRARRMMENADDAATEETAVERVLETEQVRVTSRTADVIDG